MESHEWKYKYKKYRNRVKKEYCKYCDSSNVGFIPLNKSTTYASCIELSQSNDGILRARYYENGKIVNELFKSQEIINMNYCIMCGRKLV